MSIPLVSFSALSQQGEKKKIKIKLKKREVDHHPSPVIEKEETPIDPAKKKIITIIKRKCKYYHDIAPPATMFCIPKNEFYQTPPPKCSRFFIDNKHCFLRECDNACISPISRTVIGFWNEKVGKECKLLPIEDETTYEEVVDSSLNPPILTELLPSQSQSQSPTSVPKSPKYSNIPRFVSDAQRARVASEPVALLREKIAKQYGMTKKN